MQQRFKLVPAVYLLLRNEDKVLLLRRANTSYQDGKYSLVAGHIDGNELATEAIAREAREEAGIIIDPSDLKFVHLSHRLNRGETDQERMDIFFETEKWSGAINNMEPGKCTDLSWFKIDNLPQLTIPLVRRVIELVQQGINYSEYETEPIN